MGELRLGWPEAVTVSAGMPGSAGVGAADAGAAHRVPVIGWGLDLFAGRLSEISGGASSSVLTVACRLVLEAQRRGETVAWVADRAHGFFPPDVERSGIDLSALTVIRLPGSGSSSGPVSRNRSGQMGPLTLGAIPKSRGELKSRGGRARLRPKSQAAVRVAELLVRSGGLGLVIVDLSVDANLPMPMQTRLAGLARKHRSAVLFLTEKSGDAPSLGSLVSLRVEARRERCLTRRESGGDILAEKFEGERFEEERESAQYRCGAWIKKDKRGAGGSLGGSLEGGGSLEEGAGSGSGSDCLFQERYDAPDGLR